MMDTVKQEVQHQEERPVGQPRVNVEEESVEGVLEDRPDDVAQQETYSSLGIG